MIDAPSLFSATCKILILVHLTSVCNGIHNNPMPNKNLHEEFQRMKDEAIQMLRDRPDHLSLRMIAEQTGLNREWLVHMLRPNASQNPRVDWIVTLHQHMAALRQKQAAA